MKYAIEKHHNRLTLYFPTDVVSTNVDGLKREIDELMQSDKCQEADWSNLKLELSDAKMVDSAGLNFVVTLVKQAKAREGTVEAVISSEHIRRTLMFTRLDKQMKVTFN